MTTLLVASTGGHLKQLHHLYGRISGVSGPFRWVTFDNAQSRSLLEGETVDYVRRVGERDVANAMRNLASARRILRDSEADTIVSTGSGIALPFFVQARSRGLDCHFIETAARIDGPSLTGRLISRIPGIDLYSQYPGWSGRWSYSSSVFDSLKGIPYTDVDHSPRSVVVTLGTYRGFPRLVQRLLRILPPEVDVLWQTGSTDTTGLGISGHDVIPESELVRAMHDADVVVAHAGVGTVLTAFEAGKCPVLVPRRLSRGEAIDDHQTQIASQLKERGLSVSVEVEDLRFEDLVAASRKQVLTLAQAPLLHPYRVTRRPSLMAPA